MKITNLFNYIKNNNFNKLINFYIKFLAMKQLSK